MIQSGMHGRSINGCRSNDCRSYECRRNNCRSYDCGSNDCRSNETTPKQKAGVDTNKRLTNHSARKYLVQKLKDNNVEDTDIMQISGHKSVESVRNYSAISEGKHKRISNFTRGC
jgi:hypothetical protein